MAKVQFLMELSEVRFDWGKKRQEQDMCLCQTVALFLLKKCFKSYQNEKSDDQKASGPGDPNNLSCGFF